MGAALDVRSWETPVSRPVLVALAALAAVPSPMPEVDEPWAHAGGLLANDGAGGGVVLPAPYRPCVADYVVEVENARYTEPGRAGPWTRGARLEVRRFAVVPPPDAPACPLDAKPAA